MRATLAGLEFDEFFAPYGGFGFVVVAYGREKVCRGCLLEGLMSRRIFDDGALLGRELACVWLLK